MIAGVRGLLVAFCCNGSDVVRCSCGPAAPAPNSVGRLSDVGDMCGNVAMIFDEGLKASLVVLGLLEEDGEVANGPRPNVC